MERLDRLSAYFNERERKRLETKTKEQNNGVPEMSVDEIRLSCLQNNGYETPELNDKLYLHFRGFRRIENLDAYTGCKSIWLDSNGFNKIENLEALKELRCLYLSKNLIHKIEGLSTLANLTILDLSYNHLTSIENLSGCTSLQTLNVSHNSIQTLESVLHLKECGSLTNVDLTNNRLEANEDFIAFFSTVPKLVTLSVNGNEITKIPSFRKKMIAAMPKLGYLDRPVEEQERLFAEAFIAGGNEAELKAREDWKEAQNQKRLKEMQDFKAWQQEQQKLRAKAREEGRSLIREFTPEEQEQRRREAEKAAADEKALLDMGIDKLAGKYWQLDSQTKHQGKDILSLAEEQLLRQSEEETDKNEEVSTTDIAIELEPTVEEGLTAATAINPATRTTTTTPTSTTSGTTKITIEEVEDEESIVVNVVKEETVNVEEVPPPVPAAEPTPEELAAKAAAEEAARLERERQLAEEREQWERQKRVQDSFDIYKRQYEARKQDPSFGTYQPQHTWSAAAISGAITTATAETVALTETGLVAVTSSTTMTVDNDVENIDQTNRPLYWSEVMDIELAKQVKANTFDFEAIAECMQEAARWKRLDNYEIHLYPEKLTKDACRLRWAELDAQNWSVPAPGMTAKDTIFRINLSDELLSRTGGAQPSYEALSTMMRGARPNYLKIPTQFPSVQDINDELD